MQENFKKRSGGRRFVDLNRDGFHILVLQGAPHRGLVCVNGKPNGYITFNWVEREKDS